jgi:hypothetical protein
VAVTRLAVLPNLEPTTYARHALHAPDRAWVEKNCYVDIWIELIHALGLEPTAMLPFVLALDFEGDQWTFFKPPHDELRDLYGLDAQELNVWRPLAEHCQVQLAEGKLISTEADAFFLPDTAGTDYQRQHTKTTIVICDFDLEKRRMGYFHNAGYFALEGEDFVRTFRLGVPHDPTFMPLFAELIRVDRVTRRPRPELVEMSRALVRRHFARRPSANPLERFAARFATDLPFLQGQGLAFYHAWAFATLRQLGAAFEAAAIHLRWLDDPSLLTAAEAFEEVSGGAKTFILKAARAVNSRKPFDAKEIFGQLAGSWQRGMDALAVQFQG